MLLDKNQHFKTMYQINTCKMFLYVNVIVLLTCTSTGWYYGIKSSVESPVSARKLRQRRVLIDIHKPENRSS